MNVSEFGGVIFKSRPLKRLQASVQRHECRIEYPFKADGERSVFLLVPIQLRVQRYAGLVCDAGVRVVSSLAQQSADTAVGITRL